MDGVQQPHRRIQKNPLVHKSGACCFHLGHKTHKIDDLSTNIYTWGHLGKIDAVRTQFEYGPFRDVHDALAHLLGIPAGEGNLLDPVNQFLFSALLKVCSFPEATAVFSPPAVKVPQKNTFLAFCVILMNPPQPSDPRPNLDTLMLPS